MNPHNPAGKEIALPVMRWLRPILEVPLQDTRRKVRYGA